MFAKTQYLFNMGITFQINIIIILLQYIKQNNSNIENKLVISP